MAAHFVEIDSAAFEAFFQREGFTRSLSNYEVVYAKPLPANPKIVVKVFTSIREGDATVRDVGKDAVRVVAIFTNGEKTYPLFRGKRIHRTTSQESVQERVLERIADAFARCAEWTETQRSKTRSEGPSGQQALTTTPRPNPPSASKANVESVGAYFGELGKSYRETLSVVSRKPWSGRVLFILKNDKENIFTYWSERDLLQINESYDLGFKVRGFKTFQGVKQTDITDVAGKRIVK